MNDSCDAIQNRLVKLHLTGIPVKDDPEVEAHLATCSACRIYHDFLNHDHQELETYAESLDTYVDDFKQRLNRRINQGKPDSPRPTTFPWRAVAAAVVLVAGLLLWWNSGPRASSDAPGTGLPPVTDQSSGQIPAPNAQDVAGTMAEANLTPAPANLPVLPPVDPDINGMQDVMVKSQEVNQPTAEVQVPTRGDPESDEQVTEDVMADPVGTVITAQGDPASHIQVFLCESAMDLSIHDGIPDSNVYSVTTDEDGRFLVESGRPVKHIVAVGTGGIAQIGFDDFQEQGVITLDPWATVTGTLVTGTQPVEGYMLEALTGDAWRSGTGYEAYSHCSTDAEGHFEFTAIPPGHMFLFGRRYRVQPGQIYELHLTAEGRSIAGQFVLPGYPDHGGTVNGGTLLSHIISLETGQDPMGLTLPAQTAESHVFQQTANDETGQFQAHHLAPGHYALVGSALDHEDLDLRKHAYRVWHEFVVPEPADEGQADDPIDLGDVELIPGDLMVGDRAPDFDLSDLEDNPLSLSSLAGRLVLLSFYRANDLKKPAPALRILHDVLNQYVTTESLVLIGMLASNYSPSENEERVDASGFAWPHLMVGRDQLNRTHIEYDVLNTTWPWNILISPDGMVLAIGLQGDELVEAIEAHLP